MPVIVSRVADFPDGERRLVEVNGRSVGVFRVGERFYALSNVCPHQGGPLCLGRLARRAVSSGPGDARLVEDRTVLLACPWHGWEYDLETGASFLGSGPAPARSYKAAVRTGGDLDVDEQEVEVNARATEVVGGGRVPGPFVAETIPVRVEDDYVVIDA